MASQKPEGLSSEFVRGIVVGALPSILQADGWSPHGTFSPALPTRCHSPAKSRMVQDVFFVQELVQESNVRPMQQVLQGSRSYAGAVASWMPQVVVISI